jgi:mono/diheme cytochrome c family protein
LSSPGSFAISQQGFSYLRLLLIIAASLLVVVGAFVVLQITTTAQVPATGLDFDSVDEVQIERGRYLALAGNCASCHTVPGGEFMAGGLAFDTPFGTIYSTNITPDTETGIGNWTGGEFMTSMRRGVRPDGKHLYPAFPYTAFTKVTDEDIVALFAYLKSVPAIDQAAPRNELSFPFNQRSLMSFWKLMFFDEGPYVDDESETSEWNRGAYVVEALAHCGACHSPRNFLGAEKAGQAMAGGEYTDKVPGGASQKWFAPNLTSAPNGLGMWPQEELVAYLKNGINTYVETFGPMNEVIINSTRHLSGDDVDAMAQYLLSLPALNVEKPVEMNSSVLGMGRTVYNLHCGTCHLPTGLGDEESAPRLAGGSLVVQASDPASLINVILYGPELPDPPLPTKRRNPMEEFQYLLTDGEIAAVASYVRNNWGNSGSEVTPEQVAAQR